jgi:hypothetical protein
MHAWGVLARGRTRRAYIMIIGAALDTITATIITVYIRKSSPRSAAL